MPMVRLPTHTLIIAEPNQPKSLADLQANQILNVTQADQGKPPATLAFIGYRKKNSNCSDQKFLTWYMAIVGIINLGASNLFEIHVMVTGNSKPTEHIKYPRSKGIYDTSRGSCEIEL